MKKLLLAATVAVSIALLPVSAAADSPATTGIAGYETSIGSPCPGFAVATCGATFGYPYPGAGWTTAFPTTTWTTSSTGGVWGLRVNHVRIGKVSYVFGRDWFLQLPNGSVYSGAVLGGVVNWTLIGTSGYQCGGDPNAATVNLLLSINGGGWGSAIGCLDDVLPNGQLPSSLNPPRVWGNVVLHPASED
jgi:hypothetical protein